MALMSASWYTIAEFLAMYRMSETRLQELTSEGRAPEITHSCGLRIVTRASIDAWQRAEISHIADEMKARASRTEGAL